MSKIVPAGDDSDIQAVGSMVSHILTEADAGEEVLQRFQESFVEALNNDNNHKLFQILSGLAEIVVTHKDKSSHQVNEKKTTKQERLEAYFSTLIYLLGTSNKLEILAENAKTLTTILTEMGEPEFQLLRLRHLQMCYNTVPKVGKTAEISKYMLFAILNYAKNNDLFLELVPYLSVVESWVEGIFGSGKTEEAAQALKEMYFLTANELVKVSAQDALVTKVSDDMAFDWLKKYLKAESEVTESSCKMVELCVQQLCSLNHVYDVDSVLNIPVVIAARREARVGKLLQLLDCFSSDKPMEAFEQVWAKEKALFDELDIKEASLRSKMQVLALATICEGRKEVPIQEIESALSVASVEDCVISAVAAKVLQCKIDQIKNTLVIERVYQRTFQDPQWADVEAKLEKWIAKVDSLQQLTAKELGA